ncbi:MAG: tRNA (adenosine(37)-N6)-threonylcarbamoyltransferase complex dimerization subunit type 1 TsaB, partial [Alphaproteobacteria bacterium]
MVKLLAFDTAAGACSAALWADGRILAQESAEMARGHAERLMPMIASVMDRAGLAFGDLDAYAVTVGPGAFTGLRVGLAAARGLALAGDRPVLGVGTLEALAAAVPEAERRDRRILAALDSKRDDVFFQLFTPDLTPVGAPEVGTVDEAAAALGAGPAAPAIIVGDGARLLRGA